MIERVRQRRQELKWSVRRLADECAKSGGSKINESIITNMEAGRRESVSVDELTMFAEALNVPRGWLLSGEEGDGTAYIGSAESALVAEFRAAIRQARRYLDTEPIPRQPEVSVGRVLDAYNQGADAVMRWVRVGLEAEISAAIEQRRKNPRKGTQDGTRRG